MNKSFFILSLAMLVIACGSTHHNLVSKIEYGYDGSIIEHEEYYYLDSNLALVTRVIYYNNVPDSSWTDYKLIHNGQTTDTIETINGNKRNIKSSDGTIRRYNLVGDKWKEISSRKIDDKGRELEWHSDNSHIWYTYDSQGRSTGFTNIVMGGDSATQKSGLKIEYSGDGLKSVMTSYDVIETDSLIISSKSVCRYDKKGRILSREAYDPDETDDNHPTFITDTYKYIGKNKVIRIESKKEYRDSCYYEEPVLKYKECFKRGLRTKYIVYTIKDGKFRKKNVNKWKYDFHSKKPLKSISYNPREYNFFKKSFRKTIWIYSFFSVTI